MRRRARSHTGHEQRDGFDINGTYYGLDDLLARYRVSLYLTAHEHSYERTFPVFRGVTELQAMHVYRNPVYPVHIVSGAAGCREDLDYYDELHHGRWSAVRSASYGYGQLRIINETHIFWRQFLDVGRNGSDTLWIVQSRAHGRRSVATHVAVPSRVPRCDAYCFAVCAHRDGEQAFDRCARQCRCESVQRRGTQALWALARSTIVRRGRVLRRAA